ncbi:Sec7 domain-containing protein [Polyplosphaeria fusca]|uniref:Sec7 domain-containing protein n=1 Tax=Polyplosphaeria fusca TaxID=682080 RepID=A0A9P4R3G2_9PLEO|nr:Sec7 domain-containing protein [Polyplosphaeria fusca]
MADYTSPQGDGSRPTTPTASSRKHKASGPVRARPMPQETFFDDSTPLDRLKGGDNGHDPLRDSHDLSFADGTRDSVVDNMLLSLDQLPTGTTSYSNNPAALYSNFDDDDFFLTNNPYPPPKAARHRGHTYASSQSSDYDLHPDDASSRYSGHHSRGRRSNSSNNIPAAMSRKGSLRGVFPGTGTRERPPNGALGDFPLPNHTRGTGKKGSKGSVSSSVDFGSAHGLGHRLGFGNRSASFDHGSLGDRSRTSPTKSNPVMDRGRPLYPTFTEYDAAPQPTIPAGPRRVPPQEPPQSPIAVPPQPSYAPPQAPVPRRRGSVRSTATSKTLRKNKSQPEPNMRLQAQEFVNAANLRDLPPIPAFQDPPAPSPTVAMRKHMLSSPSTPTTITTPKEKPGFFRRVFGGGSSKNQPQLSNSSTNSNSSYQEASPSSSHHRANDPNAIDAHARPRTTPSNSNHIASQLKSFPRAPQTAVSTQQANRQAPQPTLAKKHSSFFRRRKKSVSENTKPPVMALEFTAPKADMVPAQPSPGVSSLRKVMNPYLDDLGSPADRYYDSREHQSNGQAGANGAQLNGFSPGYKPHQAATVRTVKPGSRETNNTPPSSRGSQLKATKSLSNNSPKLKLKLKHGRTGLANPNDDSFLADSSSCNEDVSGRATPAGERSNYSGLDETRRSETGPTSLSSPQPMATNAGEKVTKQAEPGFGAAKANTATISTSQSASEVEEDGWVITAPTKKEQATVRKTQAKSQRVWLEPTSSEENLNRKFEGEQSAVGLDGAKTSAKSSEKALPSSPPATTPSSDDEIFHSATSLPAVHVDNHDSDNMPAIIERPSLQEVAPTDADKERALKIFNGHDEFQKAEAAAILGDVALLSTRTRKAYMDLFDWSGFNILLAMRDLCGKLMLRAETQQVDRILMALSERWCECNPNHGFKTTDVVHTVCYSLLLLNTDLHLADIDSRMTRSQFVKNTLPTVVRICKESLNDGAEETLRPRSTLMKRGSIPWADKSEPPSPAADTTTFPADVSDEPETKRSRSRLSVKPPIRTGSDGYPIADSASAECNALVNSPHNGSMKGWEYQMETVLKEFYNSVRQHRLPLHGAAAVQAHEQPSSNSLSVGNMLRRTPSVLSKAPSDNVSYRGRSQTDFRSMNSRWIPKTRSRARLYPNSTVASSRTSLDDGSVWSPAGSSTWSRYSFGKTQTSMSMESLGSHFAHGDYQQAIGFANALSQAIIREEGMTIASSEEFTRVAPLLEDETLELAGAPWAKEGILKHKHHLESLDKKAKDRTWSESFAVIEKGYMRLFSFSMNSKSMRLKNKSRPSAGSVVGGGNWMDNAEALDSFLLRQTIASALPPPGYSKSRPHVWALSLPTGAVHLFQVGTPDIVREFVTTANYWSARLSKEPLTGGVSNIEYGWSENVVNPALLRQDSTPSTGGHMPRPSIASSMRSSVDQATGTIKARLPGDKVMLQDWSPPTQSMMASNLMEVDQLRALSNYVKNVEEELARHNELRAPMLIAFSPRHPNASKSMANWERKSSYLLREIVKFRTYIEALNTAQNSKDKIYAAREAEALNETEQNSSSVVRPAAVLSNDGVIKATPNSELTAA